MSSNVDIRPDDDVQPTTEPPTKNGLLSKLKKLFRKMDDPTESTTPEDEPAHKLFTPEELELRDLVTFFTDIIHTLAPYRPNVFDELLESNTQLVDIVPIHVGDRFNILGAKFFDENRWNIVYTREHTYDALRKYLSSPRLETIVEPIVEETQIEDEKSEYSQLEQQGPVDGTTYSTSTETLGVSSDTVVPANILVPEDILAPAVENEIPALFALLPKVLIQNRLKEMTSLDCIPSILYTQISLDGQDGLNWIIEDNPTGAPVRLVPQRKAKSDHLEICINGHWTRLRGSKKARFLDDLARIQVAYATITSEHLGSLTLMESTADSNAKGLFNHLNWNNGLLIADIQPTSPTPRDCLLSLSPQDAFTTHLLGKAADKITFAPGPYPLSPPPGILSHVLVDPHKGTISNLSNSIHARTVPWEFAALPPLRLSRRSHERYMFSLKRHYFGTLVRNKGSIGGDEPKLYELACREEGREVWECIGGVLGVVEGEWRGRMVSVVLGRKGWEEEKRKWDEGIIV